MKSIIIALFVISVFQITGCTSKTKNNKQIVPKSPQPQLQNELKQMLELTWSAGVPMPQGLQDNAVQVIDNWLISVGGFCGGRDADWKKGKYTRGFLNKVWGLNLKDKVSGWVELPSLPADKRQAMISTVINNKMYVWGGFSYTKPYTYKDGYRISQKNGKFIWEKMPNLPWPLMWSGVYTYGSKIYLLGGADYDKKRFYTAQDRTGKIKHLGSRMLVLDTGNIKAGWRQINSFPGTPRCYTTSAVIDNKFYVIGGVTVSDSGAYMNVVDNWSYDPESDTWQRLRDCPISASGSIGMKVYKNRYIILPASYQYENYLKLDGTSAPKYGEGSIVKRTWKNHPHLEGVHYFNHVFVYDSKTNLFGIANNLPFDDAVPPTIILGNVLYLFANETAGFVWDGEYYGHQPEFVLKGKIEELNWEK